MGVTQAQFDLFRGKGYEGQINSAANFEAESRTVEDATAVKFGHPAIGGVLDNGAKAITGLTAGDFFEGIAIRKFKTQGLAVEGVNTLSYKEGETADLMTVGKIYVTAGVDIVKGDPVGYVGGAFTNTGVKIAGATYTSTGLTGALVEVELRGLRTVA
jgi:hypothetical protein